MARELAKVETGFKCNGERTYLLAAKKCKKREEIMHLRESMVCFADQTVVSSSQYGTCLS